jgi:hypothetical protein
VAHSCDEKNDDDNYVTSLLEFHPKPPPNKQWKKKLEKKLPNFEGTLPTTMFDYNAFVVHDMRRRHDQIIGGMSDRSSPYTWPLHTSPQTYLDFLDHVGILGTATSGIVIVKYIMTVEKVLGNNDGCFMRCLADIFGKHTKRQTRKIQENVIFFSMTVPGHFHNTPFENLSKDDIEARATRIIRQLIAGMNLLSQCESVCKSIENDTEPEPIVPEIGPTQEEREERDLKPQQLLLNFLFQEACSQGLRRTETAVFKPVFVPGTQIETKFFEYYMDINVWIFHAVTPSERYPVYYDAMTLSRSTPGQITDLLGVMPDIRFPFLNKSRTYFSYRNAIFNAANGCLYQYIPMGMLNGEEEHSVDELPADLATSNFFDVEVPLDIGLESFLGIKTLSFDKIFRDQDFDDKCLYWMYAFTGRLLHDVNSLDHWEITPYIRGIAGSGKSTFYKKVGQFYEPIDIGLLADDCEERFVDQHLVGKRIVLCLDISSDFRLSSTRFNNYASGEDVVINRKFKTALSQLWTAPIACAR